jgi:hypothetical protein
MFGMYVCLGCHFAPLGPCLFRPHVLGPSQRKTTLLQVQSQLLYIDENAIRSFQILILSFLYEKQSLKLASEFRHLEAQDTSSDKWLAEPRSTLTFPNPTT